MTQTNIASLPTDRQTFSIGSWVSHIDEQKRGLANLLAQENILVTHADVETALFNVATRELVLPKWQNISVDQYDLLIGHEIGHAKFTDYNETLYAELAATPGLMSYLNVVEDARIERFMKNAYPGLRGSFRRGYEDFVKYGPIFQDLKPMDTYTLIDRLNIHFKIGHIVNVPFSAEELPYVRRMETTRSFMEAVLLARELYQAQKQQNEQSAQNQSGQKSQKQQPGQKGQKGQQSSQSDASNGESGEQSDETSDSAKKSKSKGSKKDKSDKTDKSDEQDTAGDPQASAGDDNDSEDEGQDSDTSNDAENESGDSSDDSDSADTSDEEGSEGSGAVENREGPAVTLPASVTDASNAAAMKDLSKGAAKSVDPLQVRLGALSDDELSRVTISNPMYLQQNAKFYLSYPNYKTGAEAFLGAFREEQASTISYMASEFLRRRTAKLQEKARVSRTGRLDMTKLHAYKFREDIFQSAMSIPKGQSHGIVMIVDGSSSMSGYMGKTIEQVLFFALFAKRVNIPFQAFLFTSWGYGDHRAVSTGQSGVSKPGHMVPALNMVNVCMIDTTAPNWNDQLVAVSGFAAHFTRFAWNRTHTDWESKAMQCTSVRGPWTGLGSTPLVSSVLCAERYVAKMKSAQKLDLMTLVVLTDGEDTDGVNCYPTSGTAKAAMGIGSRYAQPYVITDVQTKQSTIGYQIIKNSYNGLDEPRVKLNADAAAIYAAIKSRHSCRILGIKLVSAQKISNDPTTSYNRAVALMTSFATGFQTPNVNPVYSGENPATKTLTAMDHTTRIALWNEAGTMSIPTEILCVDGLVVIGTKYLDLSTEALDLSKSKTDRSKVKQFIKTMKAGAANKVFVNALMPFIA